MNPLNLLYLVISSILYLVNMLFQSENTSRDPHKVYEVIILHLGPQYYVAIAMFDQTSSIICLFASPLLSHSPTLTPIIELVVRRFFSLYQSPWSP